MRFAKKKLFFFEFSSTFLKISTETKCARSLNRHRVMIFGKFFREVILSKSSNVRDLQIRNKIAFATLILTEWWFILSFFAN